MSSRPPPLPPPRPVKARRRTTNPSIAGNPAAPSESSSGRVSGAFAPSAPPISPIDVEAIEDDDVELLSSPRGFPQARRRRPVTVDLEEEEVEMNPGPSGGPTDEPVILFSLNTHNKRERIPSNRTVINCETSLNCEDNYDPKRKKVVESPPVPPKEPTFSCPICMNELVQATSTTCGHIFCHSCIKDSIQSYKKCPMCTKKLTAKSFHRIYLPCAE